MIFTPCIVLFGATFLGQSTPTIITMIIAMQHNPPPSLSLSLSLSSYITEAHANTDSPFAQVLYYFI